MPTVLQEGGFAVRVYRDHNPPHVHVVNAEGEVMVALGDRATAPYLLRAPRMKDWRDAVRLVAERQEYLLAQWEKING